MLKTTGSERFKALNSEEAKMVDKINASLMFGAMNYLHHAGFTWIEVPTITKITGACENVDTLYKLMHFGQEAYLAQTGQLYLETKIPVHEKLWTIITSSRAEKDADERHLNQFQLIELEHAGNLESLLKNIEKTVKNMIRTALNDQGGALFKMGRYNEVVKWESKPFEKITYTDAVKMLKGTELEVDWGGDLKAPHEKYIVEKFGKMPTFITHYPKSIKFFNMRQNDDNEHIVNSADLIMPYSGESGGSAERENDYDRLVNRLRTSQMFKILSERGVKFEDFADYLDTVKRHPILHSGVGLGFSRISQAVLGVDDIRVTTNYPLQSNVLY